MKSVLRSLVLAFWLASSALSVTGVVVIAAAAALFGGATVGHAGCGPTGCVCDPSTPVPCVDGCCPAGNTCNPVSPGYALHQEPFMPERRVLPRLTTW